MFNAFIYILLHRDAISMLHISNIYIVLRIDFINLKTKPISDSIILQVTKISFDAPFDYILITSIINFLFQHILSHISSQHYST